MKILIEGYIEDQNSIEVDYTIDGGEIQTTIISRDTIWVHVNDGELNVWIEDKWDYEREEHYTVDHETDIDEYIKENLDDLILAQLYSLPIAK